MLLVLDNLSGHKTPALVLWLVEHGVMPLYTPLSGSWLNMAESIQRILVRRALAGQTPDLPGRHHRLARSDRARLERRPDALRAGAASASSDASAAANATTMPSAAPVPALAAPSIGDLPPSINGVVHAK